MMVNRFFAYSLIKSDQNVFNNLIRRYNTNNDKHRAVGLQLSQVVIICKLGNFYGEVCSVF